MTKFVIHALRNNEQIKILYDNEKSTLNWEDGTDIIKPEPRNYTKATSISENSPGRKGTVKVLKVSLGLSCNYECNYCSQRFVPHAESTNPDDIDPFISQLTEALLEAPERIEFWGGEPFVYWKTLKPLAEKLRILYPEAQFLTITNGSLLDTEKNEWLDRMGFSVGVSHDGPGYHARGADPLDDPEKKAAIMDLWSRLGPQGRMGVNAMLHNNNRSRADVQTWLYERFGPDVNIGEGSFIDPYDEGGLDATFDTEKEHVEFRVRAFNDIRTGKASGFTIVHQKIKDFIDSIHKTRPASALGQKCGMDKPGNLAIDLNGNALTCQNVSAASIAPNGQSHHIGHLSNLSAVKMKTSTHWSNRKDCPSCPVLQLCKGSCMFLEGQLWDSGCDASYSDNIPFLAAAIEYLTGGCVPVYIEGDFREDRKDIFGQVNKPSDKSTKKRIIPIKAA